MESAVLATLAYADIFDYPLTLSQLRQFLIGQKTSLKELKKVTVKLVKEGKIVFIPPYYFLPGRTSLTVLCRQRAKFSQLKLKEAKKAAALLRFLPQVKLVGVSGSLAVNNADFNDDIDFFIITAAGQLWLTRFLTTGVLTLLAKRRLPESRAVANKICLNMFIDERYLEITPHDLYLAHEVLQMRPLFWRDETYQRFLAANRWAYQFLPNWPTLISTPHRSQFEIKKLPRLLMSLESLAREFQLKYMAKRRTVEKITAGKLQFHPRDVHKLVLDAYAQKLKKLELRGS